MSEETSAAIIKEMARRDEKARLVAAYQELEKAVYDLYYLDGDFNKVWVDALTAVAWLKRRLEQEGTS